MHMIASYISKNAPLLSIFIQYLMSRFDSVLFLAVPISTPLTLRLAIGLSPYTSCP